MTVAVNGKEDVLTIQEIWDLCRVHTELGLATDQMGRVYVGDPVDPGELESEVKAIIAHEPRLTAAGQRILKALET